MKKRASELEEKEKIKTLDLLYTAASCVEGRDAMKLFLRDLLTESERVMLGRRIWIARLILQGKNHHEISEALKIGRNTVYRVARWLEDAYPGYEKAIEKLEKEMDKRAIRREIGENPFSYAAVKRKYPLHYLFFPEPKPKKNYRE